MIIRVWIEEDGPDRYAVHAHPVQGYDRRCLTYRSAKKYAKRLKKWLVSGEVRREFV